MIQASDGHYSPDKLQDKQLRTAIVIFNLAIVFHRQGIQDVSTLYFSKAKTLYDQAFLLLSEIVPVPVVCSDRCPFFTGHALIDMLVMALWNNLGHIHMALQDTLTSERVFRQLICYTFAIRAGIHRYSESGTNVETIMLQESEHYLTACRYSTSAFLLQKLGQDLKSRAIAPHIFETQHEAEDYIASIQ